LNFSTASCQKNFARSISANSALHAILLATLSPRLRFSCPVTPLFPRYKFHHLESDTTLKAVEQKEQAQLPAFPRRNRNRNRLMPSRLLHNDPLDSSQAVHGAKSQAALHYSLCTLFSIGNRKTLSHIILFLFHQL
jgi:hypothetical protein